MSVTILHLSDFHTGKDDYGHLRLFDAILEEARNRCISHGKPDLVLITGDVANRGVETEYRLFLDSFLSPLRAVLGSPSFPVLIVPGNHDIDRTKCPTTVSYGHAVNYLEYFDPTPQGLSLRQPSSPRFAAFHKFLDEADLGCQRFDGQKSYFTVEMPVEGTIIRVVGLNSAWLSQDPVGLGTLYGGKNGVWEERECLTPGLSALDAGLREATAASVTFVLSHHPISWFRLEDQERMRALLGQNRVLFFHGHLHRTQSELPDGVGFLFRALQAGAAFQAREDSIWRNRYCWYEVDPESLEVIATPLSWSAEKHSWVIDGDAFPSTFLDNGRWRLPGLDRASGTVRWVPPYGCIVVSAEYLASLKQLMSDEDMLAFFDGSIPTWRHVISGRVPTRVAVTQLVEAYSTMLASPGPPMIRLLSGAGGEGKSTVLLQIAAGLVRGARPWRVLYVANADALLTVEDILSLPVGATPWLVVVDDAERVAEVCANAARALWEAGRLDVHFLLAARDTDWKAMHADTTGWHEFADFHEQRLRGLTLEDTQAVVNAWQLLGERGLGRLAEVPTGDRAAALRCAMTEQSARSEGSFFGAALQLRLGEGLIDHVRSLLFDLADRMGSDSHTLFDALVLIAAPHSINVLTLTPDILAFAVGASPAATRRHILVPLGEEAAATQDGRFLLVRHRAVAQAIMEVAVQDFGIDDATCFETLVRAAIRLRPTRRMPGFTDFNFLSKRFREVLKRPEVALRLARVMVEAEPQNRHYLQELGVCFGQQGQYAANLCSSLASVADYINAEPPTNGDAAKALAAIGFAFWHLWEQTDDLTFASGMAAVVNLGSRLQLYPQTASHFTRYAEALGCHAEVPIDSCIGELRSASEATWETAKDQVPEAVHRPSLLRLDGLALQCAVSA